jgi:hypothetical protein
MVRWWTCMLPSVTLGPEGWVSEACCTWGEDRGVFRTNPGL